MRIPISRRGVTCSAGSRSPIFSNASSISAASSEAPRATLSSDPKSVMQYVRRVNPHLLIGVPRFYEKLYAGVLDKIAESSRPVSAAANWALETGARHARAARGAGRSFAVERLSGRVADRLILRRLRTMFGSNMRYLVSGSAPMPLWLLDWFEGIGLPVFEAYGVSEDIVPIAMNRPGARRPGTVGKPLAGQEVRLADDNEILVRGPGVFHGYAGTTPGELPAPDDRGFWATGDYGEFDADGFLRVRGRKSDAFKLSTGRWVAPAGIEDADQASSVRRARDGPGRGTAASGSACVPGSGENSRRCEWPRADRGRGSAAWPGCRRCHSPRRARSDGAAAAVPAPERRLAHYTGHLRSKAENSLRT